MASKGSGGGRGAFESTGNWLALASFTDGLSNTALASERMSGTGSKSRSSIAILRISPYIPDSDEFLSLLASESIGIRRCDVAGQYWNVGDLVHSWYNHVAPPNFRLDALLGGQSREGRPQGGSVAASSAHLGKVNVCMGDGSVAAQDSGIDVSVWRALGTRDAKD